MTRHIVLGNGKLLVNIDKWLQVRDIYFPHVGQYNHLIGHAHRIAVLEDNNISWVNEESWNKELGYLNETLITDSKATNKSIKLELHFSENVYCEDDIFFRKIIIKNKSDYRRKLRLCFHHDFHLYGDGIGDTALYHPKHKAIVHYKRSSYFLIGLCAPNSKSIISDYNIGKDVEPGWNLPRNPIAQGSVDSILCTDLEIEGNGETTICYFMTAGKSFDEVFELAEKFTKKGIEVHLQHSQMCQKGWLATLKPDISVLDERMQQLYKRSLLVIKTQIDHEGAIVAANDSDNMQFNRDTYSYMWPRDGALVAIALIRAGYADMTKKFFEFCSDVLYEEGCLLHKYNPDKTLGSSWHPWVLNDKFSLPIQEDQTGLVLHALWIYYQSTKDREFIQRLYKKMIKPMGAFLSKYRYANGLPKESFDLWEERRGIFTFTTSAVLAGLIASDKLGELMKDTTLCKECNEGYKIIKNSMISHLYNKEKGYFRRGVSFENEQITYDDAIDSSAYGLFEFGVFDANDEKVASTMGKVREWLWLKTEIGGIARYYNDHYHQKSKELDKVPGNPWFICTLWYAKWLIKMAKNKEDLQEALKIINWTAEHALPTGIFPEQMHPNTGEPLSVSPLTWSHAEFVDAVTNYVEKYKKIA